MRKVVFKCLASICIAFSFNNGLCAQAFDESDTFGNAETFEEGLPSTWEAINGGSIEISTRRFKQGAHSLRWNWLDHSKLIVTDPQLRSESVESNSGLKVWLYSEVDIGDNVRFEFYDSNDRLRCAFDYEINFVGWRGLWVRFWDDIAVSGSKVRLDRMEVKAPENTSEGALFFDIVEFASSISYKRSPSYQYAHPYPYQEDEEVKDEWASWIYEQRYPKPTIPVEDVVTPEQREALATITTRFEEWLLGNDRYRSNSYMQSRLLARDQFIAKGLNLYSQLGVSRNDEGIIHGPGLFASKSTHRPKFGRDLGEDLCLQLALDYRLNGNEASKDKVLLIFDYMHDQGHAAGSAMETTDHQKLRTAAWAYSVYLLKDELKNIAWKDGKSVLDREMETQRWLNYFNILFAPLDDILEVSVDDFRSNTIMRLMYILMMDNNDPVKVQYMKHYTQWLNRNLRSFEGWTGGIKPDGMGYHHRGPYMNAYSNNGIHVMTQVLYFMRHTSFDVDTESKETLKKYLLNYQTVNGFYDVPKGVSGRISGLEKAVSMITPFAYLSNCMRADEVDQDLARGMMRYWQPNHQPVDDLINKASMSISYFHTPGEMEAILDVVESGVQTSMHPSGLWIKPYAAMAVFRGEDWFVSVKGSSAYVWDYESGSNENTYGRYDSYGQMETINNQLPYPSMVYSGHDYNNGWDWNRVPGITGVNNGLSGLISSKQRVFTPNSFVGGVHQQNSSGVWAMEFEDVHYGSRLKFKKSIFFFEPDMMVCLGSDISSAQSTKTETSIVQNVISSSGFEYHVNGILVDELNYSYVPSNVTATLFDNKGKGIYIPDDRFLNIEYKNQDSETMRRKSSKGNVFTAWFNHSEQSDYEYSILMNTTQNELSTFAVSPDYDVLQHDGNAHIVRHTKLQQTGYALFEANVTINDQFVASSSRPVMLIVRDEAHATKKISICNPDFNRRKLSGIGDIKSFDDLFGPFQPQSVDLVLTGAWSAEELPDNVSIQSKNNLSTVIHIETHDAKTYDFTLQEDSLSGIPPGAGESIVAWPNPCFDKLYFTFSEQASLYDLNGTQLMFGEDINTFDLARLKDGLYILESIHKGQVRRAKIIKATSN